MYQRIQTKGVASLLILGETHIPSANCNEVWYSLLTDDHLMIDLTRTDFIRLLNNRLEFYDRTDCEIIR
jgi:hypothetical protein